MDKYKAMKEEVRSKTKKRLKTEEEESLIERGSKKRGSPFGSWWKKIMVVPCHIKFVVAFVK